MRQARYMATCKLLPRRANTLEAFKSLSVMYCRWTRANVAQRRCSQVAHASTSDRKHNNGGLRIKGDGEKVPPELIDVSQDVDPAGFPKRKVALTLGYVGTRFRGESRHACL